MNEKQWRAARNPENLWKHKPVQGDRKRRLVACACARRLLPFLWNDTRARVLIEACERHADGTKRDAPNLWKELLAARRALVSLAIEALQEPGYRRHYAVMAVEYAAHGKASHVSGIFTFAPLALRGQQLTPGVTEMAAQLAIVRDIFGNPFRPVTFSPSWRTDTAVSLARGMYESREFSAMPILADSLQDAGCDNDDVLNHCRDPQQVHVRGCWVVDLVLGKA